MKAVIATLSMSPNRRKYNENLRKALKQANIEFTEVGTKFGKRIEVEKDQENAASRIILSVKLK